MAKKRRRSRGKKTRYAEVVVEGSEEGDGHRSTGVERFGRRGQERREDFFSGSENLYSTPGTNKAAKGNRSWSIGHAFCRKSRGTRAHYSPRAAAVVRPFPVIECKGVAIEISGPFSGPGVVPPMILSSSPLPRKNEPISVSLLLEGHSKPDRRSRHRPTKIVPLPPITPVFFYKPVSPTETALRYDGKSPVENASTPAENGEN
ncbi:hypothetical protein KM043_008914 [Ampulex compressa]|nr:hypothetical protein KM043_008914 [Ampulex compressa]